MSVFQNCVVFKRYANMHFKQYVNMSNCSSRNNLELFQQIFQNVCQEIVREAFQEAFQKVCQTIFQDVFQATIRQVFLMVCQDAFRKIFQQMFENVCQEMVRMVCQKVGWLKNNWAKLLIPYLREHFVVPERRIPIWLNFVLTFSGTGWQAWIVFVINVKDIDPTLQND